MSAKEGENKEKRERASEGIEESYSGIQEPTAAPANHTAPGVSVRKHTRLDWAMEVDEAFDLSPINCNTTPVSANPDRTPPVPTKPALINIEPDNSAPTTVDNPTPVMHIDGSAACNYLSPVAPDNPTPRKPTPFDWAEDVDARMYIVAMDPTTNDTSCDPVPAVLEDPARIALVEAVINQVPAAFVEHDLITPVSTAPPTAYGPRDFSTLRSSVRNPWGSINHRHSQSHPARIQHRDPGPYPLRNSHLRPHQSTSPPQHIHPHSHLRYPESFRINPSLQLHSLEEPQPPINMFQVIQHPYGISNTKPKITKNIPAYPTLSAETQEHNCVPHCTCGAVLPVHGPDQGGLRSRDPRWRFGRRFSRRFRSRFWNWERGRSHFRGGCME